MRGRAMVTEGKSRKIRAADMSQGPLPYANQSGGEKREKKTIGESRDRGELEQMQKKSRPCTEAGGGKKGKGLGKRRRQEK